MTAKNSAKPDSAPKPTPKTVLPPPWAFLVAKHPRFLDLFNIVFPGYVAPDEPGYTMKHGIDAMKGLTPIVCLALAARYNRSSATMATYTALHGVYGLLWVIKSYMFPDKKWEKRVPWSQLGLCITILGGFWLIPYRIAKYNVEHSPARLGTMIAANIIGVFLHFASDMQKDVSLELAPGKLITSKFFSIVRHPNYLGELLIYASFVGLSDSVFFNAHLALLVATYWVPCMWWKEQSMSRYDEWKKYAQDTKAIIPFLL